MWILYIAFLGCLGIIFYISFLEDGSIHQIEWKENIPLHKNVKEIENKNEKERERASKWDKMYYLCHHCQRKITKDDMMYCYFDHYYCSEKCRDEIILLCKEYQKLKGIV